MFRIPCVLALALAVATGSERPASRWGDQGFIEYLPGTLPLVLAAPHGGRLTPADIPDRQQGTTVADSDTDRLAEALAQALAERTGRWPHLVVCHLARIKVDTNRSRDEGSEHPLAAQAWDTYHGFLAEARDAVKAGFAAGLLVDVHGHGREPPRVILGYALSAAELAVDDQALEGLAGESEIRDLGERSPAGFAAVVRGPTSLGGRLAAAGFPTVPSPAIPAPGDDPYFSGGYTTRTYGSREGGSFSAVQIETHRPGLRDSVENRAAFASAAADALLALLADHAGLAFAGPVRRVDLAPVVVGLAWWHQDDVGLRQEVGDRVIFDRLFPGCRQAFVLAPMAPMAVAAMAGGRWTR